MSALPAENPPSIAPMGVPHLDAVAAIEASAYGFPWSRGNFVDSLAAGYLAEVLLDDAGRVLGYYVAMQVVDEMHLLNITVAPAVQRRGHSIRMLDRLVERSRERSAVEVWLEVRETNVRAREVYERYGFEVVGRRPGYYPAPGGREDALLMSLPLSAAAKERHGLV